MNKGGHIPPSFIFNFKYGGNGLKGHICKWTMNVNSVSNQVLAQPETEFELPKWNACLIDMSKCSCFHPLWNNL
jgi:hypothetical protein